QLLELLGLEVGGQDGVGGGDEAALRVPGPGAGVAVDAAGPALDLDEEEPHWGEQEQIDLVDAAVEGDELEVGPGPVGLVVGPAVADEVEGVPLPGIPRLRDGDPVLLAVAHATASPVIRVVCHSGDVETLAERGGGGKDGSRGERAISSALTQSYLNTSSSMVTTWRTPLSWNHLTRLKSPPSTRAFIESCPSTWAFIRAPSAGGRPERSMSRPSGAPLCRLMPGNNRVVARARSPWNETGQYPTR